MKNSRNNMEYIKELVDKYKYPIIVLALGLLLIMGDGLWSGAVSQKKSTPEQVGEQKQLEQRLSELLEAVDGAGRVLVTLTVKSSEQTVYAKDSKYNSQGEEIVVISGDGGEKALVERTSAPAYKGAVVVCDGADNSKVRLELTGAVKALTGVTADNIIILKMKK